MPENETEFDVVIVGSGMAGALAAYRLAQARPQLRIVMIEAGGVAPDSLGRYALVRSFMASPTKLPDSPFCGDDILAPQPSQAMGKPYYDYDPDPTKSDLFKSYYERLVGGSTWHWQGIFIRMIPSDFEMNKRYGVGFDWPITYDDLEPWYVEAEYEMGVAGNDKQIDEFFLPKFGGYRSRPFPMPELVPSYLDAQVSRAVSGKPFRGVPLRVTNVPHAINSQPYDGRPACDGHTSCVPLCPIKARYDAVTHVEKALAAGVELRTQAIVTRLELDQDRHNVRRVWYRRWSSNNPAYGSEQSVSGRIVILAANAIETPLILFRSNGAANSSGLVGCYLMDHPIKQSFALAPGPLFPFRGPQTTSDIEAFRDGEFRRHSAAFKVSIKNDGWSTVPASGAPRGSSILPTPPAEEWKPGTLLDFVANRGYFGTKLRDKISDHAMRQITLNSACEQLPVRGNRVTESDKGATPEALKGGLKLPRIQYRVDDERNYVRRSFDTIVELHKHIFHSMGIDKEMVLQEDTGPNLIYGGSGHIMGTTIMGTKPEDSVVNRDCRCHDIGNLYILSSSVFPTSSTANPTSTIAALSLRAAATIGKRLRLGERI
jgi:choline dehydrogenase-like flavoprotein